MGIPIVGETRVGGVVGAVGLPLIAAEQLEVFLPPTASGHRDALLCCGGEVDDRDVAERTARDGVLRAVGGSEIPAVQPAASIAATAATSLPRRRADRDVIRLRSSLASLPNL